MHTHLSERLNTFLSTPLELQENFAVTLSATAADNQRQTNDVFSDKWGRYADHAEDEQEKLFAFQRTWYLALYGFETETALAEFLRTREVIFDAGCGLGYKAAWFAELAPETLVVAMDFSDAARQAADTYSNLPNLVFLQGDVAQTPFRNGTVDYVSCDQVIMHTEDPEATFAELCRITTPARGEFACYFYAKKALPRELLDAHFRELCKDIPRKQMWELSEQLTELGRRLSDLDVRFDAPEIPLLGIQGGEIDIQRFLYWNFLKCFWNPELGHPTSVATNFDWYSPSNARRFDATEVRAIAEANGMGVSFFHSEQACHSGRFVHVAAGEAGQSA